AKVRRRGRGLRSHRAPRENPEDRGDSGCRRASAGLLPRLDKTREDAAWRRQGRARLEASGFAKRLEIARIRRNGEQVEKLRGTRGNERLRENRDLAHDFGGCPEHG